MYTVCVFQSGQEFHADLYPDTLGRTAAIEAEEWWKGGNKLVLHTCTAHLLVRITLLPVSPVPGFELRSSDL